MHATFRRRELPWAYYHQVLANPGLSWTDERPIEIHVILQIMLRSVAGIHNVWRRRVDITTREVEDYARHVTTLRNCWLALKWKATPWVHWVLSHSSALIRELRNIFMFSSIPSEMRHKPFKRDLRHCFLGGKHTAPRRAATGIAALVAHYDAIDKQLQLQRVSGAPAKHRRLA